MRNFKKIVLGFVLLLALTNLMQFNALAGTTVDTVAPTTDEALVEPPTDEALVESPTDEAPVVPATDAPPFDPPKSGTDFIWFLVELVLGLMLISAVGWFVYDKFFRSNHRKILRDKTEIDSSLKPITQFKQSKIPEPIEPTELIKILVPTKGVDPEVATAKVERPVLLTASSPISPVTNAPSDQIKFEPEIEGSSVVRERVVVRPPQRGESSSFARHDWWDKDKEWCQVSPLGMSSDVVCDIGTSGTLAIAAASLRGHKHKVSSEPCQDAFNLRTATSLSGQSYVIAVLCDGMSSAKHSEYGARRTSQLLALGLVAMVVEEEEAVTEQKVESFLPEIFKYCKENLVPQKRHQFGAPGIDPKKVVESDFFTTVTFMIIPTNTKPTEKVKVIIGSIGDSAVFVLNNSTSIWKEAATISSDAEILNPATSAFPATFDARVSSVSVDTSDLIIATSDGVGNFISVRGNQTLLGNYLAKQWAKPVNLPTFINDVGFDLKSADDDRTVIAIWLSRSQ